MKHFSKTEIIWNQSKENGVFWMATALEHRRSCGCSRRHFGQALRLIVRSGCPVLVCCEKSWCWVCTTAVLFPQSGSNPEPRGITDSAGQAPLGHEPPQEWISVFTLLSGCLPSDVKGSFLWFRTAEHQGISLCSSQEHYVGLLKSLCIGSLIYILFSSKTLILS